MKKLKELLAQECSFRLSEKLIDKLLENAEIVKLKKNGILIMEGSIDSNVYILKDGIIRYSYMNGTKEMIFAFAMPGSVMIAMHSFYAHLPAFYQLEACCPSEVLKISPKHYNYLVETSHEFARWALTYSQAQIFYLEKKDSVVNGDARERFLSLVGKRPEIVKKVQSKYLASYLGITQQYLSRLKAELKKAKLTN